MVRAQRADPYRDEILVLYASCRGNLIRVHEELVAQGAKLSYQTLTAFCRRHEIGRESPRPTGRYDFEPGVEMQHDTSPHQARVAKRIVPVQSASLVLGYSRMIYVQCYPRFTRFECKIFLTEAITYFGGSCKRCVTDNTHVVVLSGTGRNMTPVPEMAAFGDRFGFEFMAHEIGDANRSGKVERPFHFIENNFLAGREFTDYNHLNAQARVWSDQVNASHKRHLHASPRELFALERLKLQSLPLHVPEVYRLHHRIVDTEGYVNVQRNRYSVPWKLIGRSLEVRESKDGVEIFDGPRRVASHKRPMDPLDNSVTDLLHRPRRGERLSAHRRVSPEEVRLLERAPELAAYLALMKKRAHGSLRELRTLLRMLNEYPCEPLMSAIAEATRYGMTDLDRLERMVLRGIAHDFFILPCHGQDHHDMEDEENHDG